MKKMYLILALLTITFTACSKSKAATPGCCPECHCKEGAHCGCSPEKGCACCTKGCKCAK